MPSNHLHLHYAVSRRTQPSQKALRAIADAQSLVNNRCSWTYERLALKPVERRPERPQYSSFPFVQFASAKPALPAELARVDGGPVVRFDDAALAGSTRVRDNLWNAHLIVAFLKHVSASFPELLLELRDDTGFVLPGAVWIRGGKVELQRDWLNRERERVLEFSGDPNAAAPFVWAEAEALQGRFFLDAPAGDFSDVMEIQEMIGVSYDELNSLSLADAADIVVNRVMTERVPSRA